MSIPIFRITRIIRIAPVLENAVADASLFLAGDFATTHYVTSYTRRFIY
jgi:hypothetical protein